jgi:glycosyl-4,4'-diaponeurosporenoate acyltransferase
MKEELETIFESKDTPITSEKSLGKKIADAYFEPKSFEKWQNGRIYEILGVRQFKKFVPFGYYMNSIIRKYVDPHHNLVSGEDCARLWGVYFTKTAEASHVALGILTAIPPITHAFKEGNYNSALLTGAVNLLVNVYPIMLQRYNRTRINNVLEKRYGGRK